MLVAGSTDVAKVLGDLSRARPIFHSEADFQHALAWQLHLADPLLEVRLETRAASGQRLDLLIARRDLGCSTALELKYLCDRADITADGERYDLPRQGAQDVRGYDVIHDIVRIEQFVKAGYVDNGAVITVTNDPSYWRDPQHGRATGAAPFRLYEGSQLSGRRGWGPQSSGTAKQRPEALELNGTYVLRWDDYSELPGPRGRFRALVVPIDPQPRDPGRGE